MNWIQVTPLRFSEILSKKLGCPIPNYADSDDAPDDDAPDDDALDDDVSGDSAGAVEVWPFLSLTGFPFYFF